MQIIKKDHNFSSKLCLLYNVLPNYISSYLSIILINYLFHCLQDTRYKIQDIRYKFISGTKPIVKT